MINDPLYNHTVFGPNKGKGGIVGKTDAQLIQDLIAIHNAENWLGMDGDSELSMFNKADKDKEDIDESNSKTPSPTSLDSSNASRDSNTPSGNLLCTKHRTPLLLFAFEIRKMTYTICTPGGSAATPVPLSSDPNFIRPTGNQEVDHRNLLASLENNPNVPRNCTITRPPPITKPCRYCHFKSDKKQLLRSIALSGTLLCSGSLWRPSQPNPLLSRTTSF